MYFENKFKDNNYRGLKGNSLDVAYGYTGNNARFLYKYANEKIGYKSILFEYPYPYYNGNRIKEDDKETGEKWFGKGSSEYDVNTNAALKEFFLDNSVATK